MPGRAWERSCAAVWAIVALFAFSADPADAQEQLSGFNIDPNKVSISGISSGAFMANQVHMAHSELIMGVGLVAGGLYTCAVWRVDQKNGQLDANITRALDRCMFAKAPLESVETFTQRAENFAAAEWIDPLSALVGDRVYLFTGRADSVVNSATVERAAEVYRTLGIAEGDLRFQKFLDQTSPDTGAGHSWVTDDCCQPCESNQAPFINDCDYDQARAILSHIYGDLQPKAENLSGTFIEFLQAEFVADGEAAANGLKDSGLVYVPKACAEGDSCALHVILHGCEQSTEVLGDTFYNNIGANEWADTNGIVVLYPQAKRVDKTTLDSAFPDRTFRNSFAVNPNGCWNWWGYAYDERFALKDGIQVSAIHGMIKRVMGTNAE